MNPIAYCKLRRVSALAFMATLLFCLSSCSRRPNSTLPLRPAEIDNSILTDVLSQYPMIVSVSPDGTKLLVKTRGVDNFELDILDSTSKKTLFVDSSPNTQLSLTWRPDSRALVYLSALDGDRNFALYYWVLGNGPPSEISTEKTQTAAPPIRWSPDGTSLLYFVGNQNSSGKLVAVDAANNHTKVVSVDIGATSDFQWSPDGTAIAVACLSRRDWICIYRNFEEQAVWVGIAGMLEIHELAWEPDNIHILLTARGGQVGPFYRLFRVSISTTIVNRCNITAHATDIVAPSSLDSGRILFGLNQNGNTRLAVGTCDKVTIYKLGPKDGTNSAMLSRPQTTELHILHQAEDRPPSAISISLNNFSSHTVYETPKWKNLLAATPDAINLKSRDGLAIPALLWKPLRESGDRPAVLIIAHGGPNLQQRPTWDPLIQLVTSRGFYVIAANYRGSTGYGAEYERLGNDESRAEDVLASCDFAASLPGVSYRQIVLYGSSYGSMLATRAASRIDHRLGAVVLVSAIGFNSSHLMPPPDLPVAMFQGTNDTVCSVDCAWSMLKSTYGRNLDEGIVSWQILPHEGHMFASTKSWSSVYSQVLADLLRVSRNTDKHSW